MSHNAPTDTDTVPPAHIIAGVPHIVDKIMAYTSRSTLATCLRVSKQFHEASGKVLYHTVRLDGSNPAGFFLGALGGDEHSGCFGDTCQRFTEKDEVYNKWTSLLLQAEARGELEKARRENKNRKGTSSADVTNFKAKLLLHVKVVSLGSHHTCVCHLYGPHADVLLANINTLRIVHTKEKTAKLKPLCDDAHHCLLFKHLTPAKLVLRNLDDGDSHMETWPYDSKWYTEKLQEVVWVVPTDGHVYGEGGLIMTSDLFTANYEVKIVFNHSWEVWRQPPDSPIDRLFKSIRLIKAPLSPHHVVYPVSHWCMFTNCTSIMYGLETVQFTPGADDLVGTFEVHFPDVHLDSDRLRQLVKDELRTGALQSALWDGTYEDPGYPEHMVYKTLEEYAALPEAERMYELDDGMPEGLEMTNSKAAKIDFTCVPVGNGQFTFEAVITGL
ncbi:hypothetical protein Q8F55_004838 [Vanrija albida]|uniref:F-box domain-containing protein n=1 Tax=Vanrija albida TaxID=181172 RepID=A0ABR3PZY2_9TREE